MNEISVLNLFWWLLLGIAVSGVGIFMVRTLGIAVSLRILGRSKAERSELLEQAGGNAEGHPVWLILVGGAVVGAWWPLFRSSLFSGLWLVLLFLALALVVGSVGLGQRPRIAAKWLGTWDGTWAFLAGLSLLILGIGIGTTVSGVPLQRTLQGHLLWGEFMARFSLYEVLITGIMTLALGVFLASARVLTRLQGAVAVRARRLLMASGGVVLLVFAGGGLWMTQLSGYALATGLFPSGVGGEKGLVLTTSIIRAPGAYMDQFFSHLPLLAAPIIAVLLLIVVWVLGWRKSFKRVSVLAAALVPALVASAGVMTYPFLLPSWVDPGSSLMLTNGVAGTSGQVVFLVWLGVVIPVVIAYQLRLSRRRRQTASVPGNE